MASFRDLTIGEMMPPIPDDLEKCQEEVMKLRVQLIKTNQKMANLFERLEMVKRSASGQTRYLMNELRYWRAQASADTILEYLVKHFNNHQFRFWPTDGKSGLIKELQTFLTKNQPNDAEVLAEVEKL
jgi:hypothetical protein